jgi:hypothetical protein
MGLPPFHDPSFPFQLYISHICVRKVYQTLVFGTLFVHRRINGLLCQNGIRATDEITDIHGNKSFHV